MSPWTPTETQARRPVLRLRRHAPAVMQSDGPLVLHDLGYVEGRRVHLVPAWSLSLGEGLPAFLDRLRRDRPEADTVVLAATGPVLQREADELRVTAPGGPALLLARPEGHTPAWPGVEDEALEVSRPALEEAAALLARLPWGPTCDAAALALAGFWCATERTGADVVVVLADLEPRPPAAAA